MVLHDFILNGINKINGKVRHGNYCFDEILICLRFVTPAIGICRLLSEHAHYQIGVLTQIQVHTPSPFVPVIILGRLMAGSGSRSKLRHTMKIKKINYKIY